MISVTKGTAHGLPASQMISSYRDSSQTDATPAVRFCNERSVGRLTSSDTWPPDPVDR